MNKTSKAHSFIVLVAASIALMLGLAACNNNQAPDNTQNQPAQSDQSQDPAAAANLVPASAPAAGASSQPEPSDSDNDSDYDADDQDASYGQPAMQASDPPPELPEYSQPDCPGDGYLWTPGY